MFLRFYKSFETFVLINCYKTRSLFLICGLLTSQYWLKLFNVWYVLVLFLKITTYLLASNLPTFKLLKSIFYKKGLRKSGRPLNLHEICTKFTYINHGLCRWISCKFCANLVVYRFCKVLSYKKWTLVKTWKCSNTRLVQKFKNLIQDRLLLKSIRYL